jgi:rod shape determining protein RodA
VRHTDYIFSVLAEELGFVGGILLLVLLGVVLWRTVKIAAEARDTFGQLLATGVALVILFQSFVNIGMNLGIVPVTGITLPFVSYGGSSLLTLLLAQGLVQSVAVHCRRLEF